MDRSLCKLTIVYPTDIADDVIELIMSLKPSVGGFTTIAAEGHGFDFSKASTAERVRGRVARGMLIAVMTRKTADTVLAAIRNGLPVPHLTYWIEPVLEVGRLVEAAVPAEPTESGGAAE